MDMEENLDVMKPLCSEHILQIRWASGYHGDGKPSLLNVITANYLRNLLYKWIRFLRSNCGMNVVRCFRRDHVVLLGRFPANANIGYFHNCTRAIAGY